MKAYMSIRKALAKCMVGRLCWGCSRAIKRREGDPLGSCKLMCLVFPEDGAPSECQGSVCFLNRCGPVREQGLAHSRCSGNVY